MKTSIRGFSVVLTLCSASCGGSASRGGVVAPHNVARSSTGDVVRTSGTGQAVSISANQRFADAARTMRQHDEANNGRGDWTPDLCNQVADAFEHAADEQPNGAFAEAWFDRGLAYDRCNLVDRERQSLQRALEVSRNHAFCRAQAQLGVLQYRARQMAEAQATFEAAIRADANCVEGYANLALLQRDRLQGEQRAREVVNNIRQALARNDRFVPALHQLAQTYLADAGDDPRSQKLMLAAFVCAQAVQVNAQHAAAIDANTRAHIADVYNTWGLIDIRTGQIIRALGHFERAYQLNPDFYEAWVNFGSISLSFRGYDRARTAFDNAVRLRPNDYDSHIALGVAIRGQGADKNAEAVRLQGEAAAMLTQADQPPNAAHADEMRQRGADMQHRAAQLSEQATQDYAHAQAEYEHAQHIDAARPEVYYNLGVLHDGYMDGSVGELRRGIEYLLQFRQRAGNNPRYEDALTRGTQHIRNDCQAIYALQQIAQVNQMNAESGDSSAPPPAARPSAADMAPPPEICRQYPPPAARTTTRRRRRH